MIPSKKGIHSDTSQLLSAKTYHYLPDNDYVRYAMGNEYGG